MATEHVPTHDRRADVGERLLDDAVALVVLAAPYAVHLPPRTEWKNRLVEPHAADAKGIVDALIGPAT
jgi:hypothetical protein